MKLFFSVGEPSGDIHGANLIRSLQKLNPDLELIGLGGPKMAEAGCKIQADMTELAVMWLLHAILNIHRFAKLLWNANTTLKREQPDAVILIDFPGFNWWMARRAKAHGIPVFYYGTPQVWAWGQWRVKKMRRLVDHVLCKLPFEVPWYESKGVQATYIGHPFFDEVRRYQLDQEFLAEQQSEQPLVAILPGSRSSEITHNFRWFLTAAAKVHRDRPEVRFAIAAYKESHAEMIQGIIDSTDLPSTMKLEVFVKRTPELIHLSECCMAVSGSVSLELLFYTKPTVILYCVSPFGDWLQSHGRRVKFVTLVNLLAAKDIFRTTRENFDPENPGEEHVLFPEYVTSEDRSPQLAMHVLNWLNNSTAKSDLIAELATLKAQVATGGASTRGAEYILRELTQTQRQGSADAELTRAA